MSIVKLQAGNTTNVTALKNFLDANKEGTFLEDLTISIDTEYAGTPKLIIASESNTFTLFLFSGVSFPYNNSRTYATLTAEDGRSFSYVSYNNASAANANAQVNEMILCNHGLLIKLRIPYKYASSTFDYGYIYILLTADSDGGLAVLFERTDTSVTNSAAGTEYNKGFRGAAHNSTGYATSLITTDFNSLKTVLAPVQLMVSDTDTAVENVFVSTQSQLQTVGLQEVTIDSDNYITNGYWYVKD